MYINVDQINKLTTSLSDVVEALLLGRKVELLCPVDGWVVVKQINLHKSREDYRIESVS